MVHHNLDVIVRLQIISLIVRIVRVCRIVRLVILLAILVLQSYSPNPFEVTVFPAVITITLLSTPFVAVLVESLTIFLLIFSLIRFRSDTRVAVETLQIV